MAVRLGKYDDDVIQAVREGKRLCGSCLGRKVVQQVSYTDFGALEPLITRRKCAACQGTGLENGKG